MVALSHCGAIYAKDRGIPQIGATTTLNGLAESPSTMSYGVTPVIEQATCQKDDRTGEFYYEPS